MFLEFSRAEPCSGSKSEDDEDKPQDTDSAAEEDVGPVLQVSPDLRVWSSRSLLASLPTLFLFLPVRLRRPGGQTL